MKTLKHLLVFAVVTVPMAVASVAQAGVDVTYANPEKFIDASSQRGYGGKERDRTLRELTRHMESQGERYLKPGQTLKIEVLDLDLAGRVEWWHPNAYDIRIMRDIDSPSMKVRYSLEENGAVIASGEEWVSDKSYLMGIGARYSNDSLVYEKTMLNDWFRNRFGKTHS